MSISYPYLSLAKQFNIPYADVLKVVDLFEQGLMFRIADELPQLGRDKTAIIYNRMVDEHIRRFEANHQREA